MNRDHYAIVIGLSRYPNLGDPPPADLQGPENDADAVYDWLSDPQGGGLPGENVKRIRSRDHNAPPNAAPTRDALEQAFLWLDGLAKAREAKGIGRTVGRRLYLYTAGHGFSPRFRHGCLLAGNAAEEQYSANVFPSGWIEWFQDAEYFQEFVLWMDCCMDRQVLTQPTPAPVKPIGGGNAPGPTFVAFGASRPLKAVEKPIPEDGGKWHGVFTWNLLQGLRGAAANSRGMVTGRGLADWLRQAQLGWLDENDRRNPDVAKEPAISDEDDALIFARGVMPSEFDVTLQFPAAMAGRPARLWSGTPPRPGPSFGIQAGGTKQRLKPGLYLAEVPGTGLRHGFSVTRQCEVTLSETGEPPVEATGVFGLTVDPSDETAEIRVVADGFSFADGNAGRLESRLPYGLYQIRTRIGRQISEKVILLDADWPKWRAGPVRAADRLPDIPQIISAAPLPDTRAKHEYHEAAARNAQQRVDVNAGAGAELMVMARCYTEPDQPAPAAAGLPWDGVAVLDSSGKMIADLQTSGIRDTGGDPVAVCTFSLAPGAYLLRYPLTDKGQVAQSLVLPQGNWRTEAYLLHKIDRDGRHTRTRTSLLMRHIGWSWGMPEDVLLEKARVALADERPILNKTLSELLFKKFDNPLAGIIGGHLLIIAQEQGRRRQLDALNEVITNLRGLVGSEHPDVEALSLMCPDPKLRTDKPLVAPPMFERSWRMFINASQSKPQLVPLALWQQVQAALVVPPFFVWSVDAEKQTQYRKALAEAVNKAPPKPRRRAPALAPVVDVAAIPAEEKRAPRTLLGQILTSTAEAGSRLFRRPRLSADIASDLPDILAEAADWSPAAEDRAESLGLPPSAIDALRREYPDKG